MTDLERHLDCVRMGDFFMIFAHATRMRIFCALQNGGKTVTRIAEEAEISVSNASQHLRLMRDRGAVVSERRGQTVLYTIADPRFFEAAALIRDALDDRGYDQGHNLEDPPACTLQNEAAKSTSRLISTAKSITFLT
ncbi:MAG: ArsR/SmtB family transcription factor [Acidobacteriota bacterium]